MRPLSTPTAPTQDQVEIYCQAYDYLIDLLLISAASGDASVEGFALAMADEVHEVQNSLERRADVGK